MSIHVRCDGASRLDRLWEKRERVREQTMWRAWRADTSLPLLYLSPHRTQHNDMRRCRVGNLIWFFLCARCKNLDLLSWFKCSRRGLILSLGHATCILVGSFRGHSFLRSFLRIVCGAFGFWGVMFVLGSCFVWGVFWFIQVCSHICESGL